MFKTPPAVIAALGVTVLLTGCSSHLRLTQQEPDYVLELREEYFAANPGGEHNQLIKNGEVVRGMGTLEVLCAWGHPEKWRKRSPTTELWIYREVDEDSKDWIQFEFIFKNGVLHEWDLRRYLASGGRIDSPIPDDATTLTRSQGTTGKRVPGN